MNRIAANLKRVIDDKGVKYTHIANKMNLSVDSLSKKLSGYTRLTAEELVEICDIINVPLDAVRSAESGEE